MQLLIRKVEKASQGVISEEWLTTFMRRKRAAAGENLFSQGERATDLYYIVSGRFSIAELSLVIDPGKMVGELGILMPERTRSQSLECREAGDLLVISYDEVHALLFQKPKFGFQFLRLIAARLLADFQPLDAEGTARNVLLGADLVRLFEADYHALTKERKLSDRKLATRLQLVRTSSRASEEGSEQHSHSTSV